MRRKRLQSIMRRQQKRSFRARGLKYSVRSMPNRPLNQKMGDGWGREKCPSRFSVGKFACRYSLQLLEGIALRYVAVLPRGSRRWIPRDGELSLGDHADEFERSVSKSQLSINEL
jgi:hypothetical protein